MDQKKLEQVLSKIGLQPELFEHPAVFSCEEALEKCPPMPGARTKQLLIKEKKGDMVFLAIVMHDKRVDMKKLASMAGAGELTFADEETMKKLLHVTPGSVTPLGLMFDDQNIIQVLIDEDAWKIGTFQFHPLVNTSTMIFSQNDLQAWLDHTGHIATVIKIPQKS